VTPPVDASHGQRCHPRFHRDHHRGQNGRDEEDRDSWRAGWMIHKASGLPSGYVKIAIENGHL